MNKGASLIIGLMFAGLVGTFICTEKIPSGYVGVQYSMNGGVSDELLSQGWKVVSPTKKVSLYSIATEQLYLSADKKEGSKDDDSFNVSCSDGMLNVDFEMSYSFNEDMLADLYTKYRGLSGDEIVNNIIRGKIKPLTDEVASNFTTLQVHLENKTEFNKALTEHLKTNLADYGVIVEKATLSRTKPNEEVEAAITKRTTVAQELEAEKQKQEKAKLEAETKKIEAQAKADAQLIEAQGSAEANRVIQQSLTPELIQKMEMEARLKHGWVTVNGASNVVAKEQ